MVKAINPILQRYHISSAENSSEFKKINQQAVSGSVHDLSVVDNIQGMKCISISKFGSTINKQIATTTNLVKVANANLKNIKQTLYSIQEMLVNLNVANTTALQAAQEEYINKVTTIIDTLTRAEFGGKKLFDGRLADPTGTQINEALPLNAAPLSTLVGTDYNDRILTSIPRLLAGDGSVVDVDAPGRFTPLFPWDPAALSSVIAVTNAIDAAIGVNPAADPSLAAIAANIASINGVATNAGVAGVIGRLDNNIISGAAVKCIQDQIESVRPSGANVYINAVFDTAKSVLDIGPISQPGLAKNAIIALANNADIQKTVETVKAINDIDAILTAAINIPGNSNIKRNNLEPVINAMAIPADASPVIRAIYNVVKSAASPNFIRWYPSLAEMKTGAVAAAQATTSANPGLAAGDVLTPAGRAAVRLLIERAIVKVNNVQADLEGQLKSFDNAVANLDIITMQHKNAGSNYLSADYSKIIPELTKLIRESKIINIAFALSEQSINRALNQLLTAGESASEA